MAALGLLSAGWARTMQEECMCSVPRCQADDMLVQTIDPVQHYPEEEHRRDHQSAVDVTLAW
eukprot:11242311-Alexandrium_andersonii.AAC.1